MSDSLIRTDEDEIAPVPDLDPESEDAWLNEAFGPGFVSPLPGPFDPEIAAQQQTLVTQLDDLLDFSLSPQPIRIDSFAGNDRIIGSVFGDNIEGGADDDMIFGGPGDDELDGDSGFDTAVYRGSILNYDVFRIDGDEFTVVDISHNMGFLAESVGDTATFDSGTDELEDFEAIRFDDYTLKLDGSNNAPFIVVEDVRISEADLEGAPFDLRFRVYEFDADSLGSIDFSSALDATIDDLSATPPGIPAPFGTMRSFSIQYTPIETPNLTEGETVTDTITITVADNPEPVPLPIGGSSFDDVPLEQPRTPLTTEVTFEFIIDGVNEAPITRPDTARVDEDGLVEIDVLDNDEDPEGKPLFLLGGTALNGDVDIEDPRADIGDEEEPDEPGRPIPVADEDRGIDVEAENGEAQVTPGGTLLYTPNKDFFGEDTITYTISDGSESNGSVTGTVTVTVTPVNDAPVATLDVATVAEDGSVNIDATENDTDVDGDALFVASASANNGNVVIERDGTLTYSPRPDFFGNDQISYVVSDGNEGTDNGLVRVTVTPVNDPPVPVSDTATVQEDGSIIIDVLANDSDVDGGSLRITGFASEEGGTAALTNDHRVRFTPDENFFGGARFEYSVSDGRGGTASTSVHINVTPVNDAPTTSVGHITAAEADGMITINLAEFANEVDGDTLFFSMIAADREGDLIPFAVKDSVAAGDNGIIEIDPEILRLNDDETATTTISYLVTDDSGDTGNDSAKGEIKIIIEGENETPREDPEQSDLLFNGVTGLAINADEADDAILIPLESLVGRGDATVGTVQSVSTSNRFGLDFNQPVNFQVVGEPGNQSLRINPTQFFIQGGTSEPTGAAISPSDGILSEGEVSLQPLTISLESAIPLASASGITTATVNLRLTGDTPDNSPPTAGGSLPEPVIVDDESNGVLRIDLDQFASDPENDSLEFTPGILRIGGDDGSDVTLDDFNSDSNVVSLLLADIEKLVPDGTSTPGRLSFSVTDGKETVTGFVSGTFENPADDAPDPEPGDDVLDFEIFESASGFTIPINANGFSQDIPPDIYKGFFFQGPAFVYETDELTGEGRGGSQVGIKSGQTTPDGSNVLIVGNRFERPLDLVPIIDPKTGEPYLDPFDAPVLGVPGATVVLNESGQPVRDAAGFPVIDDRGLPRTEFVVDNKVVVYAEGASEPIDSTRVLATNTSQGVGVDLFFPDAPSFNLDGLSLNMTGNESGTVTLTTYRLDVLEEPGDVNNFSDYRVDVMVADTFVFAVDASTPPELINFNAIDFADDSAEPKTDTAGTKDIYAFSVEISDDSFIVLDDIMLTNVDDLVFVT